MYPFDYPYDADYILQKKRRLRKELLGRSNMIQKKVAILSGSTIGEIKNILELFLLSHGIQAEFWVGEYARYFEDAVYHTQALKDFAPDILYVHTTVQNIQNVPLFSDTIAQAKEKQDAEIARWKQFWTACTQYGAVVIQNNFELPNVRVLGNFEAKDMRGMVSFTRTLNHALAEFAQTRNDFLIHDIEYLSAEIGLDHWFNPTMWYAYQYALDLPACVSLCASISNMIKALYGKNKKAIITDLDHTLWGGVIGDDGVEGILLGQESGTGRAFTAMQGYLKQLSQAGILLNVCSKNEEEIAKSGFTRAQGKLKVEDFVVFCANWKPKDENIKDIANTLNLLPESFVFLDDNPAEREIVKTELPGVSVPTLTNPEEYLRTIARSGFFEGISLSEDDARRSLMYQENLKRQEEQTAFVNYADYLKSLQMTVSFAPFMPCYQQRITQLINKTNQFNPTTRRCTIEEVQAWHESEDTITLCAHLEDKFGDNGLVSAFVGKRTRQELQIDIWVMSCRVFQRDLEKVMFSYLLQQCKKDGIAQITAEYIPSAKNQYVQDLYDKLGFILQRADEQQKTYQYVINEIPQYDIMQVKAEKEIE